EEQDPYQDMGISTRHAASRNLASRHIYIRALHLFAMSAGQNISPSRPPALTIRIEACMILPKMSAALLSMSFFGSAYASAELHAGTSLDQWIVICGA